MYLTTTIKFLFVIKAQAWTYRDRKGHSNYSLHWTCTCTQACIVHANRLGTFTQNIPTTIKIVKICENSDDIILTWDRFSKRYKGLK